MKPEISELFEVIEIAKRVLELISSPLSIAYIETDIERFKEIIVQLVAINNPTIPEPWASMTAEEIMKEVKTA